MLGGRESRPWVVKTIIPVKSFPAGWASHGLEALCLRVLFSDAAEIITIWRKLVKSAAWGFSNKYCEPKIP
jgi:hypothetical protein